MDTPALKPCPHCGSPAIMQSDPRPQARRYWVVCSVCPAMMIPSKTLQAAADAWNQRAAHTDAYQAS